MAERRALRIGIGGPVGSGKTALVDALCKSLRDRYRLAVVTNDIYTKEDQEYLIRSEALAAERIVGATLDTGGWLALTRRGLSPRKIRQASLGATTT